MKTAKEIASALNKFFDDDKTDELVDFVQEEYPEELVKELGKIKHVGMTLYDDVDMPQARKNSVTDSEEHVWQIDGQNIGYRVTNISDIPQFNDKFHPVVKVGKFWVNSKDKANLKETHVHTSMDSFLNEKKSERDILDFSLNWGAAEGVWSYGNTTPEYKKLKRMDTKTWQKYLDNMAGHGITVEYDHVHDEYVVTGSQEENTPNE